MLVGQRVDETFHRGGVDEGFVALEVDDAAAGPALPVFDFGQCGGDSVSSGAEFAAGLQDVAAEALYVVENPVVVGGDPDRIRIADLADRKSTRLNYSKLVISYGVFCLK